METNKELEREILDNLSFNQQENQPIEQEEPQQEEEVVENQEQEESQPGEEQEEKKGSPKQSWKELRQKAELADKYQKERDEYLKMLKDIEANYYQSQQQPKQVEEEPDFDTSTIDDDELLTGKELKSVLKKEQKRINKIEEKLKYNERYSHENAVEAELKSKYNDLQEVLTLDNINKLKELRPGLARSLSYNPDLKEKAIETYQAIKDLGIYGSTPQSIQKDMANKNQAKPRSSNTVSPQHGGSPLNKANMFANGLTKELQQQLYEDMLNKSRG